MFRAITRARARAHARTHAQKERDKKRETETETERHSQSVGLCQGGPGESDRRRLRSLLLCLCDAFRALPSVDSARALWISFYFRLQSFI